jgi:pimeloyl-ACP methyl ester carboxylesterase
MSSSRPSVLLLHGQPGGARDWTPLVIALGDGVDAIAIDRPGWDGHSPPRNLAGNAAAALEILDARGIEQALIVGHSLGAAVAARLVLSEPERVAGLVLAAPAANRAALEPFDRWLGLPVAGRLASSVALTGLGLALRLGPARRRVVQRTGLRDAYLKSSGQDLMAPWAHRAFFSEQRTMLRELGPLQDSLHAIHTPTWIVSGSEDRIVSTVASRVLATQVPDAELVVLRGAGHLLPQRHAPALAQTITAVLDRLSAVTG